jgi:glyoxylase-like metal-dependent hydrolase (beta-lactamase superfamily II)
MARSKKPMPEANISTAGSKAHPASVSARGRASVRMYRQGLGDCFLITLPKQDGNLWRMLIDCGVILGTQDVNDRMREAIANIVEDTGGRVDVLVITHEHYDHVAAFAGLKASFCSDTQNAPTGSCRSARYGSPGPKTPTIPSVKS